MDAEEWIELREKLASQGLILVSRWVKNGIRVTRTLTETGDPVTYFGRVDRMRLLKEAVDEV